MNNHLPLYAKILVEEIIKYNIIKSFINKVKQHLLNNNILVND